MKNKENLDDMQEVVVIEKILTNCKIKLIIKIIIIDNCKEKIN